MSSQPIPLSLAELESLPRRSLQSLCKLPEIIDWGRIKANAKTADIITALTEYFGFDATESTRNLDEEAAAEVVVVETIVEEAPIESVIVPESVLTVTPAKSTIQSITAAAAVSTPIAAINTPVTRISMHQSEPSIIESAVNDSAEIAELENEIAELESINHTNTATIVTVPTVIIQEPKAKKRKTMAAAKKPTAAAAAAAAVINSRKSVMPVKKSVVAVVSKPVSAAAAKKSTAAAAAAAPAVQPNPNDMYWTLLAELDARVAAAPKPAVSTVTVLTSTTPSVSRSITAAAANNNNNNTNNNTFKKYDRIHRRAAAGEKSILDHHNELLEKKRKLDSVTTPACASTVANRKRKASNIDSNSSNSFEFKLSEIAFTTGAVNNKDSKVTTRRPAKINNRAVDLSSANTSSTSTTINTTAAATARAVSSRNSMARIRRSFGRAKQQQQQSILKKSKSSSIVSATTANTAAVSVPVSTVAVSLAKPAAKIKFDLKESLAKPVTWKMKKGTLRSDIVTVLKDKTNSTNNAPIAVSAVNSRKSMAVTKTTTAAVEPLVIVNEQKQPFVFTMPQPTVELFTAATVSTIESVDTENNTNSPILAVRNRRKGATEREFKGKTFDNKQRTGAQQYLNGVADRKKAAMMANRNMSIIDNNTNTSELTV